MDQDSAMQQPATAATGTLNDLWVGRSPHANLYADAPVFLMNLKLAPPELPAACIERAGLLANLETAAVKKLTVLAAPTGSGKTVLLGQWQRSAALSRTIAWLSLDAQDDQPSRFFAYLVGAIDKALPDSHLHSGCEILQTGAPVDAMATWLAETLCCVAQPVSVVIDDFQHLHDPDTLRAFAFVVHRSPAHVRWILCGRSLPELACSELKLSDDVCIIDRQSLGFDGAEILALSRELRSTTLSPEQAERILLRTEGCCCQTRRWPMAMSRGWRASRIWRSCAISTPPYCGN
jgi:LuxR family maltose regulon positive regulatory protein